MQDNVKIIIGLFAGVVSFYVVYLIFKFIFSIIRSIFRLIFPAKKTSAVPSDLEFTIKYEEDNYRDDRKLRGKPAQWYENGESVNVKGYDISGGLIYVGETLPDSSGYGNDACLINPKLKVSPADPWEVDDEMGYWAEYGRIPALCRGAYLKWLATGRSEPEANIGYVFLFFYGLERRLLVDGPKGNVSEKERSEIVNEVKRLLKIYGNNNSFCGYANKLLAAEWMIYQYQKDKPIPDYIDLNNKYDTKLFQIILAENVVAGKPISANIALQWINSHPEFYPRTPARRCANEFRELFILRYSQKFGDGFMVKPNKTPLRLQEYYATSPSIRGRLKLKLKVSNLPDPFNLTGPMKKLRAIAEKCTAELEAYSRYLGRKDNNPESLAALSLLPKDLMIQAPGAEKIQAYLKQACMTEPGFIPIDNLYNCFGEKAPSKLGKKESESLALLAEGLGFGMAPDVRFHNAKPSPDGKVVIFQHGHGVDFQPSKEYCTVGAILRMGAMVSQIDEDISPFEEKTLQSLVHDNRELNSIEKESLLAFLHWCLRTPQGTAGLKQSLAGLSTAKKTAISHILISVAHADGRIDPKEVKQLEKLYSTLGLDKKQVTSDLHTLAAMNEPVTVGFRDHDTAFSIPKPPTEASVSKGFCLNEELIRIREEETQKVKGVLEGIFSDQDEDETDTSTSTETTPASSPLASLDEAHQSFFNRLLTQETWERSAVHELCKELGLMVDGAMEVINEWAFDNVNAPLIDDGEPVYVDINLAKEIINAEGQ